MALDFNLLGQGPQFQNILASFNQGKNARAETETQNALALYGTDPDRAVNALMRYNPKLGIQLGEKRTADQEKAARKAVFQISDPKARDLAAQGTGDPEVLKAVSQMRGEERATLKELTQTLGGFWFGLRQKPEAERAAIFEKAKPYLQSVGADEQTLSMAPTDAALDAEILEAQTYDKALEQFNKDRDFQATDTDRKADNLRADDQLAEQKRGNRVSESQRAQGLAYEGQRVGLAANAAAGRPVPAPVAAGYRDNATAVAKIDAAIAELKKHPKAVGLVRAVGEGVNQRIDPDGIGARAAVSDIGSQKIHDRSGANVTASESPRLKPFIPTVTDGSPAAIKKLERMKQEYLSNNAQIEAQYGTESGFRPMLNTAPPAAPASGGAVIRYDAKGSRVK